MKDWKIDNNSFEHDYILRNLDYMVTDLRTAKPESQVLDKYACILTAFMMGMLYGKH